MSEPFTEEHFQERKAELERYVAAAQVEHDATAFKFELGEVDEQALERSRSAVATLKDRLSGLHAAKQAAIAAQELAAAKLDAAARNKALATIEEHLSERVEAAQAIKDAIDIMKTHLDTYRDAGQSALKAALPFLSGKERGDLHYGAIAPPDREEFRLVSGMMFAAGFDLSNFDARNATFAVQRRGLVDWVRMKNDAALGIVSVMAPDEDALKEAA